MKKVMVALSVAALSVAPFALAQEGAGAGGGRGGRGAGGPGGAGGPMQERMKEAWAALDKQACFKAMDTNADGTISKEEFGAADLHAVFATPLREAMAKRAGTGPAAGAGPGAGPAQWDKNGDGKVTADEFPRGAEAFKTWLERGDKDGDGALSTEELKAVRETMRPPRPERKAEQP